MPMSSILWEAEGAGSELNANAELHMKTCLRKPKVRTSEKEQCFNSQYYTHTYKNITKK